MDRLFIAKKSILVQGLLCEEIFSSKTFQKGKKLPWVWGIKVLTKSFLEKLWIEFYFKVFGVGVVKNSSFSANNRYFVQE